MKEHVAVVFFVANLASNVLIEFACLKSGVYVLQALMKGGCNSN